MQATFYILHVREPRKAGANGVEAGPRHLSCQPVSAFLRVLLLVVDGDWVCSMNFD